jgi:hypothetical protein
MFFLFLAILQGSLFPHIHTAFFHYNETEVKNIYDTPVTEEQVLGRTLLKCFAVGAAHAQQRFGVSSLFFERKSNHSKLIH